MKPENSQTAFLAALKSQERFIRLEDGWVRDSLLDIEWGPCSGETIDFEKARKYCAERGGRMPEVHELHSLVDFSKSEPAVNTDVFSDMKHDDWYWTGTKVAGCSGGAWCVYFRIGVVFDDYVGYSSYVRPCRASQ